jgi:hypothetical protein
MSRAKISWKQHQIVAQNKRRKRNHNDMHIPKVHQAIPQIKNFEEIPHTKNSDNAWG